MIFYHQIKSLKVISLHDFYQTHELIQSPSKLSSPEQFWQSPTQTDIALSEISCITSQSYSRQKVNYMKEITRQ